MDDDFICGFDDCFDYVCVFDFVEEYLIGLNILEFDLDVGVLEKVYDLIYLNVVDWFVEWFRE